MKVIAIVGPFRPTHTGQWPLISPVIRYWQRWRNIRRAMVVAREVWELGAVAYLPHTMSGFLDGVIPDDVILPGLLELCGRCDAGRLVKGWQRSIGSLGEKWDLEKQGKPVFEHVDELRAWLSQT